MSDIEQYQERGAMVTRDHQGEAVQRLSEWATSAQAAMAVAQELCRSSFVPESFHNKPGEATAAILAGLEVGLQPMAALRSFDVIQGQAAARAVALRAIVQSHGHEMELVESTATRCKMRGRRRGSDAWQDVTWTMDRARQLGVTNKSNWKSQPQAMLVARCTSELARLIASDAILGVAYSSEEIADGAGAGVEVPEVLVADPDTPGAATAPAGKKRMSRARKPKAVLADEATTDDEPTDAVVLAGDARCDEIQALIDGLTQPQRDDLTAWWKAEGIHSLSKKEITADEADRVQAHIAMLGSDTPLADENGDPIPAAGATPARNSKMHAMVAEAWPDDDQADRERKRKGLIKSITTNSESSKALTSDGWDDLFVALEEITEGRMELHLRSNGGYELRPLRGAA